MVADIAHLALYHSCILAFSPQMWKCHSFTGRHIHALQTAGLLFEFQTIGYTCKFQYCPL